MKKKNRKTYSIRHNRTTDLVDNLIISLRKRRVQNVFLTDVEKSESSFRFRLQHMYGFCLETFFVFKRSLGHFASNRTTGDKPFLVSVFPVTDTIAQQQRKPKHTTIDRHFGPIIGR